MNHIDFRSNSKAFRDNSSNGCQSNRTDDYYMGMKHSDQKEKLFNPLKRANYVAESKAPYLSGSEAKTVPQIPMFNLEDTPDKESICKNLIKTIGKLPLQTPEDDLPLSDQNNKSIMRETGLDSYKSVKMIENLFVNANSQIQQVQSKVME